MPKLQLIGKIRDIFPVEHITSHFKKRVFWLSELETENVFALELHQGDVDNLEKFRTGDKVTVYADLRGKLWQKGVREGVITTLRAEMVTAYKLAHDHLVDTGKTVLDDNDPDDLPF